MAKILVALVTLASVGCSACSTKTPQAPTTVAPAKPADAEVTAPPGVAQTAPSLVVLIVVDQLGSWVLDRYLPLLPPESVLRVASEKGAFLQAAVPFASTQTAPGHASLGTGVPPAMHGVAANAVFDPVRGRRKTVDDGTHAVIGNPERFVSPAMLEAPTVADALRQHTGGQAKIVGISIKGRAAVLPVGQKPTAAVFFDSKAKGLTTSTFYSPNSRYPEWLRDFRQANPVEPLLQIWEPENSTWLEANLGPNELDGAMYPGFPHDPKLAPDPLEAFAGTPESTDYLIAAAFAAVKGEEMGMDSIPDLLVLSISGTDIIGHVWGPESWEYADNLIRTDRALGRFVRKLQSRGPVAFILTADHGVAMMPEQAAAEGKTGGRLRGEVVEYHAERAADDALGPGDWIAAYVSPFLTYTEAGKLRRRELDSALESAMPTLKGVQAVYAVTEAADLRGSRDDLDRLVGASIPKEPPGDLYLVTEEGWFDALSDNGGTNHGTPWVYDRKVPILMWGTAIERRTSPEIYSVLQVATSVAALLGIPPLDLAPREILPGVMQLPD